MTREDILAGMARTYRLYRRLQLSLERKPLNRQFKNPKCKSAEKLRGKREAVQQDMVQLYNSIIQLWMMLPEVLNSELNSGGGLCAMQYAASLVKRRRRPRFLKNQPRFGFAQPEEATVSQAGVKGA